MIAWRTATSETKNVAPKNARETSILFFFPSKTVFFRPNRVWKKGGRDELLNDDNGKKAHAHYATYGIRLHDRFGPLTGLPAIARARDVRAVVIAELFAYTAITPGSSQGHAELPITVRSCTRAFRTNALIDFVVGCVYFSFYNYFVFAVRNRVVRTAPVVPLSRPA